MILKEPLEFTKIETNFGLSQIQTDHFKLNTTWFSIEMLLTDRFELIKI